MSIEVRPVRNGKEKKVFLHLPWKIYAKDPHWTPPLLIGQRKIFNTNKNPFFEHAEMERYLAYRDGEPVGRIAAIQNHLHDQTHHDGVGFFGFFECQNDQEAANALLKAAEDWVKGRGLQYLRGPASPSINDEYGMLLENFDEPARILMQYNPRYYIKLMEAAGYNKEVDLLGYKILAHPVMQNPKISRMAQIVRERQGVEIKEFNMKDMKGELAKIKQVYNKAWEPNHGYVPITQAEFDFIAEDIKSIAEPKLLLFAEVDGKTVGFAVVLLDYNYVFRQMNGRLLPFNWIKLFTQKKNIIWCRIQSLGILPEYQRKGIDGLLYYEIAKRCDELGLKYGEVSWILENNTMMNRAAELMDAKVYRKWRLWQKPVA